MKCVTYGVLIMNIYDFLQVLKCRWFTADKERQVTKIYDKISCFW